MAGGGVRRGARLLLVALCAASACTGDDAEPSPTTAEAADATLRLGVAGPLQVDPAAVNPGSPAELMVADLLHDGLTQLDADGAVVPGLAVEWDHDADTSTWTFTLEPDATFSDGEPLTADAVVRSINRVAASAPSSLAALRLEGVVGFDELAAGDADELAGVRAPDPTTVEIQTADPLAVLPAVLAAPEMGIVAASFDGDEALTPDTALSGRWQVVEADDEALVLAPRAEGATELAAIEVRRFDDSLDAYDAFDAGELDWALVPGERVERAIEDHGDGAFAPFHAEVFLGLHLAEPLTSEPLRQAIAAAIDRDAIVAEVYADVADPLATLVPAGVPGHAPDACGDAPGCEHDADAAEALLADAFPDGEVPTVIIDFDDSDRQQALADAVAEDLRAVGIPAQLRSRDREAYRSFVASGDQRLFSLGWIGGYASPDAYLAPLLVSGADDNLTGVADPEIDLALAVARATDDRATAAEAWAGAERRALAAAVVVPIAQFRTQAVVAPRVVGLAHRIDGTVDWAAVSVQLPGG